MGPGADEGTAPITQLDIVFLQPPSLYASRRPLAGAASQKPGTVMNVGAN
jgi:hypothetical protein